MPCCKSARRWRATRNFSPPMQPADTLRRRIRLLTGIFIAGLFLSGATAIPLESELNVLTQLWPGVESRPGSAGGWLARIREALHTTNTAYPFMAYGTDWLAFGHFMIALVFVGALRDPVRNEWLFTFGMLACVLIIPYAFVFGQVRGIPVAWRLIDCSFGVFGLTPFTTAVSSRGNLRLWRSVICSGLNPRTSSASPQYLPSFLCQAPANSAPSPFKPAP